MFEFHILTIGQISRNRFWGELETQAYREPLCTSTLIRGEKNIIVDPSLPPEKMAKVLYDRSGLKPEAINSVFITHAHGDHFVGLELFEKAQWFMSDIELRMMETSDDSLTRKLVKKIRLVEKDFMEDMEPISLPGHTNGTTGLIFNTTDGRTLICGDAVMTRDFFRNELGYYNSVDMQRSAESIRKIRQMADFVVPGHDNYFIVK